jgi:hypothetical protein
MATGKGAYFAIDADDAAVAPTDVSAYTRAVTASSTAEDVDATVLTSTKREREATFEDDTITLRFKWSPAAATFALGLKDQVGLNYEYGPNGDAAGKPKISGTCNVLRAQSIPGSDPNALTELEVELSIISETHGTFA